MGKTYAWWMQTPGKWAGWVSAAQFIDALGSCILNSNGRLSLLSWLNLYHECRWGGRVHDEPSPDGKIVLGSCGLRILGAQFFPR